jgi:hypothetical protein
MLTVQEAQQFLNAKRGDSNILFVGEYQGDKVVHSFKCIRCQHTWRTTPNALKRAKNLGCPHCRKVLEAQSKPAPKKTSKRYSKRIDLTRTKWYRQIRSGALVASLSEKRLVEITKERKTASINRKVRELKKRLKQVLGGLHKEYCVEDGTYQTWHYSAKEKKQWARHIKRRRKIYKKLLKRNFKRYPCSCYTVRDEDKIFKNIEYLRESLDLKIQGKTKLYYIRLFVDGKYYYKVGITINSVFCRFSNRDFEMSPLVDKVLFESPVKDAKKLEQVILVAYAEHLANKSNLLKYYGGNTEIFKSDVLGLDQ